jgi:hypothetical protein
MKNFGQGLISKPTTSAKVSPIICSLAAAALVLAGALTVFEESATRSRRRREARRCRDGKANQDVTLTSERAASVKVDRSDHLIPHILIDP